MLFGLFAMLCTSALQLVCPLILAEIIDKSIPRVMWVRCTASVVFSLRQWSWRACFLSANRAAFQAGSENHHQVQGRGFPPPAYPAGGLVQPQAGGGTDSEGGIGRGTCESFVFGAFNPHHRQPALFIGIFVVLFLRDWKVAIYVLPMMAVAAVGYNFLIKYLSRFYRLIREKNALVTAKITDYVQGMPSSRR